MSKNAIELAAEVLTSFVSYNSVPRSDLSELFQAIHDRLKQIETGTQVEPAKPETPAVPVRKSVTPDYLICLDDGRRFKSLRRHLATLGMTPEQARSVSLDNCGISVVVREEGHTSVTTLNAAFHLQGAAA